MSSRISPVFQAVRGGRGTSQSPPTVRRSSGGNSGLGAVRHGNLKALQGYDIYSAVGLVMEIPSLLWLIYTAGFGLGFRLGFGLQTQLLHCTMQQFSKSMESDTNSNPNCYLQEWDRNLSQR